jgi:hypothetical protein
VTLSSWSFHGLGAAVGVTLSKADTIAVAEPILGVPSDLVLTVDG